MKVEVQKEWLDLWYKYMKNEQLDNAKTRKKKIEEHLDEFTDPDMKKLYEFLLIRYHVMFYDLEKAAQTIAETAPKNDKYHWLNYYYYFFRGFYHLECHEYKDAVNYFTRAKLFISDIDIEETAELFYKIASAYYRTFQISRSIKYSNKAIRIFDIRKNFTRVAHCENLLAVSNLFINQYKESLTHYNKALEYAEITNNKNLKIVILHNLGDFYTSLNKPNKALYYLNKIYSQIPSNDGYLKCQNFYLLAKNLFKINETELATKYIDMGFNISLQHKFIEYQFHFTLLKLHYLDKSNNEELFKEAINYFNANEHWDYVIEYSESLATHFREIGNHKEAMYYFHLAVETKNKIKKERVITSA